MNLKTDEYNIFQRARGEVFNLIAALLCEPDDDAFFDPQLFERLIEAAEMLDPKLATEVVILRDELQKQHHQQLLIDYTKLFLGPFKVLAQPYSSVYFGVNELYTDTTRMIEQYYADAGLFINDELKDLPDHIVVESEFQYYLITQELIFLDQGNMADAKLFWQKQVDFLTNHYSVWVPVFASRIRNSAINPFYDSLANCLDIISSTSLIPSPHPSCP